MEKTLLEQLKSYLLEMDKKRKFTRLQNNLEFAIKHLDPEEVSEFLQEGASIELLEKQDSTLGIAADSYGFKLFEVIDQYRKQKHMKYDEYHRQIYGLRKEELDPELNAQMEEVTKRLLEISELLYQHGANINHNTYLAYKDQGMLLDMISEKREIVEIPTVFEKMIVGPMYYSKDISILKWAASKPDLDVKKLTDSTAVTGILYAECPESVQALQLALERGIALKDSEALGIRYNSLIDCLIHQDISYRQEKFNILWQMATEEQRNYLVENYHLDSIEIPVNFGENTSGTSDYSPKGK